MKFHSTVWFNFLSQDRIGKKNQRKESSSEYRTVFEVDYDRIVFSHAFRVLQEKTQVHTLPTQSMIHNRLTHSLEVASVARSLGKKTGLAIQKQESWDEQDDFLSLLFGNVLSAAALAHDIGNPPFGHGGESAISNYFIEGQYATQLQNDLSDEEYLDLCNFEGNAQGFRLLSSSKDLSLSSGVLGTFTKYPCLILDVDKRSKRKSRNKFGIFQSEKDIFLKMANNCQLPKIDEKSYARHPLAFLLEAADDICYNIIDLEDAYHLKILSLDDIIDLLKPLVGSRFDQNKLDNIYFSYEKVAVLRAMAMSTLISATSYTFLDYSNEILYGNYDRNLTTVLPIYNELKKIETISGEKIYNNENIKKKEKHQNKKLYDVLDDFFTVLIMNGRKTSQEKVYDDIFKLIHPNCFSKDNTLYERIRFLLDYICMLTDRQCMIHTEKKYS